MRHAATFGLVPLWHGLSVVTTDASSLRSRYRASYMPSAASSLHLTFRVYLLCSELMLTAQQVKAAYVVAAQEYLTSLHIHAKFDSAAIAAF